MSKKRESNYFECEVTKTKNKMWSSRHQEASPIDLQGIQRPLSSNCLSHALSHQAKPHRSLLDCRPCCLSGRESARGEDPGANRTGPTTRQGGRAQEECYWEPIEQALLHGSGAGGCDVGGSGVGGSDVAWVWCRWVWCCVGPV